MLAGLIVTNPRLVRKLNRIFETWLLRIRGDLKIMENVYIKEDNANALY